MMGFAGRVRLVPIVVFAAASLLALKALGLFAEDSEVFAKINSAWATLTTEAASDGTGAQTKAPEASLPAQRSFEQGSSDDPEYTGAIGGAKAGSADQGTTGAGETSGVKTKLAEEQHTDSKPSDTKQSSSQPPDNKPSDGNQPDSKSLPLTPSPPEGEPLRPSAGERAVLEALNQRRQELDTRTRELDIRESLLKGAEKRIETRLGELKAMEERINSATQKKDDVDAARFKGLVIMYENMKPKDAAKIFDRLDLKVLVEVAGQINPRRMADILAQMSPEVAERLTMELANRPGSEKSAPDELPKIEGKPSGT